MKIHPMLSLCAASLLVCSCSNSSPAESEAEKTADVQEEPVADEADPVQAMDEAIAELEARPEHTAGSVKVQHLLVSFNGAPRMTGVTRSLEEAELLTAELWQQIQDGADFDALIREYTNDSAPGIYPMTMAGRRGMVPGFGNVGWRLEVGQFGVAPYDAEKSPYGWHIIKRLE